MSGILFTLWKTLDAIKGEFKRYFVVKKDTCPIMPVILHDDGNHHEKPDHLLYSHGNDSDDNYISSPKYLSGQDKSWTDVSWV